GGTEMCQVVHLTLAQGRSDEVGVPLAAIRITTTDTSKVPNAAATGASSGSDLNGMAAQAAAGTIRQRLLDYACESRGLRSDQVRFANGQVHLGAHCISFGDFVREAYTARRSLSATGYYRTPKIHW